MKALDNDQSPIPCPPEDWVFVGPGDFTAVGELFLKILIEQGGLKPHHQVLDVGCGIGRIAAPLTRYLNTHGSYDGFDIVDLGIEWCQREITSRFPKFRFHHADVFNRGYNPQGRHDPATYRFPFRDERFDFVFLTSIFTHMLPVEMHNYLAEVVRVMKRGGTCLITYFLRNEETVGLKAHGKGDITIKYEANGYCTSNRSNPEELVAYDESLIRELYRCNGLELMGPIYYGSWCGRTGTITQQDVVVARKVRSGCLLYPRVRIKRRLGHLARRLLHGPLQKLIWRGRTIEHVERARAAAKQIHDAA